MGAITPVLGIPMNIDRFVLGFAGSMGLLSLALGVLISQQWLWLGVFVGLNLLQASFTRFCPLALILRRLGVKSGAVFS